ncbi:GSU2403 family nucleotidyltransferase fold protein [Roseateles saccharophilus]|uniref:GSU2403 family nucleotidyltransferase fold protein n=1 Tax=Roseateles saccharophilus TaxID=304 RepID=UPI001404B1C1|nr:GSU2403 family nucleotidyltransferase fold protein [Roseateles saccharophilus]
MAAQAAYSSVLSAARMAQLNRSPADLPGGFASKQVNGRLYWYYQRKGPAGLEQIYVGPDDKATRALIEAARNESASANQKHLRKLANAAAALGCYTVAPKHFRVLKRLADHGVFSAGALVVGTHAFLAYQNVLGVIWGDPGQTVDLDFDHAGRNLSLALAPDARVDAHSAIESLQMGFVPVNSGTRYVKPDEPDFDLDWLTSRTRTGGEPVDCPALNVTLQPLRFMELALEAPIPAALLGSTSAIVVNLPAPAAYAVGKLLVAAERTGDSRSKTKKDIAQAAALIDYFLQRDPDTFVEMVAQTRARGPAWRKALDVGLAALHRTWPRVGEALAAAWPQA